LERHLHSQQAHCLLHSVREVLPLRYAQRLIEWVASGATPFTVEVTPLQCDRAYPSLQRASLLTLVLGYPATFTTCPTQQPLLLSSSTCCCCMWAATCSAEAKQSMCRWRACSSSVLKSAPGLR